MTTNHPLIGRRVKTPTGSVFTVVGSTGFQPALDNMMPSGFFVPVITADGYGTALPLVQVQVTVLDDEPAAEDERVAKLRALALVMCGIFASKVDSAHLMQSFNLNKVNNALSLTGIDEDDSNDAIIEKALAIIEASR